MSSMNDVTQILNAIEGGDSKAADELLPLVYDQLRRLAAKKLSHERAGQTLTATALVHEAYMRLIKSGCSTKGCHKSRGNRGSCWEPVQANC